MTFYLLFVLFVSGIMASEYFFPNKKKLVSCIVFAMLVFVSGFRYRVGSDYNSYVDWYLHKTRDSDFEFGFLIIMNLFREFHLSPQFLFFFFSFFTYLFVYLGIKKYTININTALLFYILIPSLYLSSFSLVRQSFSVAISFYAFYYLINKKYIFFFLLMLIGVSVHRTCLLPFIVFLFVVNVIDRIKIFHFIIAIIISLVLSKLNFIYIFNVLFKGMRYDYYFSNQQILPTNYIKLIALNGVGLIVLFFYERLKKAYFYQKYLLAIYFFSLIVLNVVSPIQDLSRFYTYFRIFEIVVITDLIYMETNRKRIFLFAFFYTMYLGTFINGLKTDYEIRNKDIPKFIPYKNIFW